MNFKEFAVKDIFEIKSSNGIYHAVNIDVLENREENSYPYVVRTSNNNGIKGYLIADKSKLNEGNTISFAQDTAQIFYQSEPYYTGNKIKILKLKNCKLIENIALFLISALNKAFIKFGWGSSFDTKIMSEVKVTLPIKTSVSIDYTMLDAIGGGGLRYE